MKKIRRTIRAAINFVQLYGQHFPLVVFAVFSFRCEIIRLRGRLKKADSFSELVYVGRKYNFEYLKSQLFDNAEIVAQKKTTLFTFRRHAREAFVDADSMVVDIGWPYHRFFNTKNEFVEIPDWVNMLVETDGSLAEVVAKFRKTARAYDLRMIRKHGYSYDLVNDDAAVDYFYEYLYSPFVKNTHGESAILADKKAIAKRVKEGKLIRIHYQGNVLAAGVIYSENNILYFLWMGSLPELPEELAAQLARKKLPEGVISALYYFGIEYANELGLDAVDFTGTRSLLSDGTFHFKRKWGAIVDDTFSPSSLLLKLKVNNTTAVEFSQNNPLIIRNSGGLEMRFVLKASQDKSDEEVFADFWKQHGCEGIDSLSVFTIDETLPETIRFSEFEGRPCCLVQCKLESFSQLYSKDLHNKTDD